MGLVSFPKWFNSFFFLLGKEVNHGARFLHICAFLPNFLLKHARYTVHTGESYFEIYEEEVKLGPEPAHCSKMIDRVLQCKMKPGRPVLIKFSRCSSMPFRIILAIVSETAERTQVSLRLAQSRWVP